MIAYKETYINSNGDQLSTVIVGANGEKCANRLSKFRISRNISRADLQSCKNDVALHGYPHTVKQKNEPIIRKENKLSVAKVLSGSVALFDIVKGDIVDDSTIVERSKICANCPLISETSDRCVGCTSNKLFKYARNLAIKYGRNYYQPTITAKHLTPPKTAKISEFYCGHCGCSCLNLVLSKSKHFLTKENSERPANCWVHKL
jgi:hypothetical protein